MGKGSNPFPVFLDKKKGTGYFFSEGGYLMPRISRGLSDGYIYHVLNRGNGGQKVFHKDKDYKAFVGLMGEAKERYSVKILGYCLMPNHFHMVVEPGVAEELSKYMQWLMTSHVRRYHTHYGTSGHIWQGRYKSFIILKDDHLLTVLRYVESNPVRAGLVGSAREWAWSSHREMIDERPRLLVDKVPIELPLAWDRWVDEPLTVREREGLRLSVNRQSPYGDSVWQKKLSRALGLESTLRSRGRPRKKEKTNEKK
ncbi:MAG: transposase [Deltaproteobacteria bacterium]|nr:transposase [Deltaproteobacteria bacterium]